MRCLLEMVVFVGDERRSFSEHPVLNHDRNGHSMQMSSR